MASYTYDSCVENIKQCFRCSVEIIFKGSKSILQALAVCPVVMHKELGQKTAVLVVDPIWTFLQVITQYKESPQN